MASSLTRIFLLGLLFAGCGPNKKEQPVRESSKPITAAIKDSLAALDTLYQHALRDTNWTAAVYYLQKKTDTAALYGDWQYWANSQHDAYILYSSPPFDTLPDYLDKAQGFLDATIGKKNLFEKDSSLVPALAKTYIGRMYINRLKGNYQGVADDGKAFFLLGDKAMQDTDNLLYANKLTGTSYTRLGEYKEALIYLRRYLQITADAEDKAIGVININSVFNALALYDSIIVNSEQVLLLPEISPKRKAYLHSAIAEACLKKQDIARAERESALALLELNTQPLSNDVLERLSVVKQVVAATQQYKQDYSDAKQSLLEARSHAIESYGTERKREVGKIYLLLAQNEERAQSPDSALQYYHQALRTVSNVPANNLLALPKQEELYAENTIMEALDGKAGLLLRQQAKHPEWMPVAVSCYQLAFQVQKKLMQNFSFNESRLQMQAEGRHRSEQAIAACYSLAQQTGDPKWTTLAFGFAEQNKALVLLQSIKENIAVAALAAADTNVQTVNKLQTALSQNERDYVEIKLKAAATDSVTLQTLLATKNSLEARLALAKTALSRNNTAYKLMTETTDSVSIPELQKKLLDKTTGLIAYFNGDSAVYAFVTGQQQETRLVKLHPDLNKEIDAFLPWFSNSSRIVNEPNAYRNQALHLYRTLLEPLVAGRGFNSLLIIPDGRICLVPFDALLTKESNVNNPQQWPYLLNDYTTAYGYSAGTLLKQLENNRSNNNSMVAFAPVFEKGERSLTPLLNTKAEIDGLEQENGKGDYYRQQSATIGRFREKAANASIIHIASHAFATADSILPRIELYDSTLYLNELYAMRLNANLVVLSACNTGIGKMEKSEGVMSLARGFYYAGAKNVITSLWEVDDKATATIFNSFYASAGNNTYTNALRIARLQYLQTNGMGIEKYSPYYWAGFIKIGYEKPKRGNSRWIIWLAIGVVVLLGIGYWMRRQRL
jgi:CHAT domain-containing protein